MDVDQRSRRTSTRKRFSVLLVSVIAFSMLAASCSALSSEPSTTTVRPTTTTSELDKLLEETEHMTEWRQSEARRLARSLWKRNVWQAANDYLIQSFVSGQIGRGDCPIGRSGISIDCHDMDFVGEDVYEAVERFGRCPGWLKEYGCLPVDDYTEPVRQLWYEERGYDYSGWDN